MKKMLDELKKLDVNYEVPQDFRKKVMEQIKSETTGKAETNKMIKFKKYVIACASVAAMFIVVVNVGTLSLEGQTANTLDNNASSFNSATSLTPSMSATADGLNGNIIFDDVLEGFKTEEVEKDSVLNKAESVATQKVVLTSKSLKRELNRINISYKEIEGKIFIQKIDLENLKETMDKKILDSLKFIEKDDKIQIIIK